MARRAVACVVVVAIAGTACGGTTKRAPPAPTGPRLTPGLARTLDAQLRDGYANEGIAGVSAAIVFPDGREWSAADGLAVVATKQPMTPRTSLPFDSVTKTATAALALRYAEEGRLRLDDTIKRWYPAWNGDPRATVRDLLGHVDPRMLYVPGRTHGPAPRSSQRTPGGARRRGRRAGHVAAAGALLARANRLRAATAVARA